MALYLNKSDYPNIDLADIGELENKGYGTLEKVRAHGIVTGATSLLSASINSVVTSLTVDDATRYPAAPFTVQINEERLRVTVKTGAVFTVTRGYDGTEAVAHNITETVFEVITEYIFKLNDGPVKAIDAVYIEGIKQDSADYTAYTGQAGDAHTDWPGVAVIAFPADGYIGKQYNVTEEDITSSETINGKTEHASHPELSNDDDDSITLDPTASIWGTVIGLKGPGTTNQAFVKFKVDYGTIDTQTYYIDVENASADEETINVDVMITEGDDLKLSQPFSIPKNQTITLEVSRAAGIFDDVLRIYSYASDLIILDMRKSVLLAPQAVPDQAAVNIDAEVPVLQQILINSQSRMATYPSTALGPTIIKQTHVVEFIDTSGDDEIVELSIAAVEKNGTVLKTRTYTLSGSDTFLMSITHTDGSWDTATYVMVNDLPLSKIENMKIKKVIEYSTPASTTTANLAASSSGKIVIGNVISVDGRFAVDTTGDYGGSGNLIERPDWVIKHFLVNVKGAISSEIHSASFSAAGGSYASAGYKLNFLWSPSIDEDQMARECRSVIYMTQGKYYLDYVPDTAPGADMIIPETEVIDAVGFLYDHGKIEDLHTDYTARYGLNTDGTWVDIVTAVDAGNKYGTRIKNIDLPLVTLSAMAQSVLDHILLQHQDLYKTVKFKTSWKYQTLKIGDTFQVSCSLHNNKKFFVEKLRINDDNTLTITGREWW